MKEIKLKLREQVDKIFDPEKYNVVLTGTSIVFLEGTSYLVKNLFTSLMLAVLLISIFMAWMFNSFRMVVVSLIPNLIPLIITASIMGYFGISIKPSTILVFSIAFGISVDDTIHFLAKYRQELRHRNFNIKDSVVAAIKETGVSMFYTSIVLFFGFFIFIASQFGGTIALGLLVSITLLIALLSNLIVLPALLLSLEKSLIVEALNDPLLDVFDEEEDIELKELTLNNK
jgi:predicted RND superfamily exporter protein